MTNMLAKYSAFVIKNSPEHDWFEVYATIVGYGPIVDWHDRHDMMLTLETTDKTQQLKSMGKLDCGSSIVFIRPVALQRVYPRGMAGKFGNVPTGQLPPTSDGASSNILDHLNNDILCSIVQSRALDVDDLCSIGSACVRFNEAAESAFRARHSKHLDMAYDWPFQRIATVLRLFGGHIKSIGIYRSRPFIDIALGLIGFYCRDIEHLNCVSLMQMTRAKARFDRRQANGIVEAMPFDKLKSLQLCGYPSGADQPLLHMLLPSLRAVTIYLRNDAASDGTRQFFAAHPHIKRMRLYVGDFKFPVKQILVLSPEVEELHLHGSPDLDNDDHLVFGQLQHLKVLKCTFMDERIVRQIVEAIGAASVPLERLEFAAPIEPAIAMAVANITSLKYIDFTRSESEEQIGDPMTCLCSMAAGPNLEEMRLHLDRVIFDEIDALLAEAPDQLKAIYCHVIFGWMSAQLLTNSLSAIAIIDRMVRDRSIQLSVTLYTVKEQREELRAKLQQFSHWLIVSS